MLTAQRSPAEAASIARFCACSPRTRTAAPPGQIISRSPIATAPAATVPVTTSPIPGKVKARSIGMRKRPDGVACARLAAAMAAVPSRWRVSAAMPSPVRLDTGNIRLSTWPAAASSSLTSPMTCSTRSAATRSILLTIPVISATPISSRMSRCSIVCGRAPVIGGDNQQYPVDRQHAGQHVGQKALVSGNVDKADLCPIGQGRIGKAEIDCQPAPFLLRQAVGVDPGQRLHQGRLAVVDMAGGREDHGFDQSRARALLSRTTERVTELQVAGIGALYPPQSRFEAIAAPWAIAASFLNEISGSSLP